MGQFEFFFPLQCYELFYSPLRLCVTAFNFFLNAETQRRRVKKQVLIKLTHYHCKLYFPSS